MPPRSQPAPTPAAAATSMALAIPADVRADLLRAQAEDITTRQPLPRLKVLQAGANLFEFGDTLATERTLYGVILNSHGRNALWDKPVSEGQQANTDDAANQPACSSTDGRYGVPREGFVHLGLAPNRGRGLGDATARATGQEVIECASCPYNQWRSVALLPYAKPGSGKGKAVTNMRSIYLQFDDRETPVELRITPSSLGLYDSYLATLLNQGVPVQSVLTKLTLERKEAGAIRWSLVHFAVERSLTADEFTAVLTKRQRYLEQITAVPSAPAAPPTDVPADAEGDGAEDIPF